jgi:hypothetical protein
MRRIAWSVVGVLAAVLAGAAPAVLADKGGQGKGPPMGVPPGQMKGGGTKGPPPGHGRDPVAGLAGALIGADERRVITDYFRVHRHPPQTLPPGIAKNLARGKPLPPGIAKRYLPPDLLGRLPRRPGHEYLLVGRDIVLLALATGVIVDVLSDVF